MTKKSPHADGDGVRWNRGNPSFESDRIARRERNAASLHEDAANMRAIHKANYERQERRSGAPVDVHEKAKEHRERHTAHYDRQERRRGHRVDTDEAAAEHRAHFNTKPKRGHSP